jgi:nitroimidazol reductase NimA-like FMN-containing flavoprotein (pyridoxamine 5'-phosphate oxidase superfamily)
MPRSTELEELSEADCRERLARARLGRVAVTIGALPAILPVNYAMLDGDVVFRTADGTKLRAALERAVVAFEIDGIDEIERRGWSVLVVGHASPIRLADELAEARRLDLRAWAPGDRDHYVRITTGMISGRRIRV